MEIMQKSCKQDPASQRRKEVMFSMKIQHSFVSRDIFTIVGTNKDGRFQMIANFTMIDLKKYIQKYIRKEILTQILRLTQHIQLYILTQSDLSYQHM